MVDENGVMISLFADGTTLSDRRGIIYGTDGRIEVDNVNNPSKVEVFTFNGREVNKKEEHILSHHSTGFEYELMEAVEAIKENRIESRSMSWDKTLEVLSIMDSFRSSWEVRIGSEES